MGAEYAQGRLVARWPTPIYLDQSLPLSFRRALEFIWPKEGPPVMHVDMTACPIQVGAKDEVWLPIVGKKDWVVIMRDKHIETRTGERDKHIAHGVRSFVLSDAGNMTKWELMDRLLRRWNQIILHAGDGTPGPWMYSVTRTGPFRKLI